MHIVKVGEPDPSPSSELEPPAESTQPDSSQPEESPGAGLKRSSVRFGNRAGLDGKMGKGEREEKEKRGEVTGKDGDEGDCGGWFGRSGPAYPHLG
jgi:hypothetical protein